MFDVFAAHAVTRAVLMFNTGPAHSEAIGCYRGDPLYHASLDAAEYEALLAQSGFEVLAHSVEDWKTGGGRTVWLARSRAHPLRRHRRVSGEGSSVRCRPPSLLYRQH
jgi:hypothetical protein